MIATTLFALLFASKFANGAPHERRATDGLDVRAKAVGKLYFGTATDNSELTNTAYVAQLGNTSDFGQITPGNSMKWDSIEPSRNSFSYTNGDAIASLAKGNGQLLRCHNLVWYNQLPSWVSSGGFDNATLISIMTNHITNEVTHYKGQCYAWDVVNEALNDDGTYRTDVFYNTIGPAYIPIAFAAAAAADPSAKLYYNDYNIEYSGAKSTAAQNIVKMIKAYGARIDGVGLQSHFIVGSTPSTATQTSNMNAFVALDVDVAITELDIRTTTPATTSTLAQQGVDYATTTNACKAVSRCVGVTIWDYTDKYSWVPSTFSGQGAALPWDDNLVVKPAYWSILSAWGSGGSTATVGSATVTGATAAASTAALTANAATTTAVSSGTQSQWGQCGGTGWTGATVCASPYTCTKYNDYYSQCI
ncbi:carbohydrate-binding module family 1 protein [Glonium stellatum]|uniref:Beta-xylanase n=1 Tax=Glonium stellatum TaxID=574774 RepID=A0A8E2F5F4_9PEZI|nr:carbohydrate-binding module family 1 protein [Glonium stellatum]